MQTSLYELLLKEDSESKRVVLVACVATKLDHPAPAKKLYDSPLFHKSMAFAETLRPDAIYILSAKHYVLPINKTIAPYDMTLLDMPADDVKAWAQKCLSMLSSKYDLQRDEFIFLAGDKYRKYLEPEMAHSTAPLKGLRIGQQLAWYTKRLAKQISEILEKLLNFII